MSDLTKVKVGETTYNLKAEATTVYFANILGQPTDNVNLSGALASKVPNAGGNFKIGLDTNGLYLYVE